MPWNEATFTFASAMPRTVHTEDGHCYSLDLECSPMVHVLKVLVCRVVLLGSGGAFERRVLEGCF
jgi:hypothetical protein